MKKEIIDDMNTRFADVAAQPIYTAATLIDPRYRGKLFSQSEFATAKQWLVDAVDAVQCALPYPVTEGATTASDDNHGASELK